MKRSGDIQNNLGYILNWDLRTKFEKKKKEEDYVDNDGAGDIVMQRSTAYGRRGNGMSTITEATEGSVTSGKGGTAIRPSLANRRGRRTPATRAIRICAHPHPPRQIAYPAGRRGFISVLLHGRRGWRLEITESPVTEIMAGLLPKENANITI